MNAYFDRYDIPRPDFCDGIDKIPLTNSDAESRPKVRENLEARLTGLPPGEKDERHQAKLDVRISDLCSSKRGPETLNTTSMSDIDSAVAIDFPLSMIKSDIEINAIPNNARQIDSNLHLPGDVTKAPSFHLGKAGEGIDLDLWFQLPNYPRSKARYNNHTYIKSETMKAWYNEILIPASECIPHPLRSEWSSNYDQELAKCKANQEGKKTDKTNENQGSEWISKQMERYMTLPAKYIKAFWDNVIKLLDAAITSGHTELMKFKGYRLLLTGKNWKTRVFEESGDVRKLFERFRTMVCQ